MSMIMQNLPDTRARTDALEELEAARIKSEHIGIMQEANRAIQVAAFCDSVSHISRRLDQLETLRTDRARRDAEEREAAEHKLIEDALSKLPDPDMPTSATADTPDEPKDLHSGPSVAEDDNEGDLPTELLEETPPPLGTDPNISGSKEPSARNPAGISW
jgi:hypothetical protein